MFQRSIQVLAACLWLALTCCGEDLTAKTIRGVAPPPTAAKASPAAAEPAEEPPKSQRETEQAPSIDRQKPVALPERPAPGGQSGGEGLEGCAIRTLPLSEAVDRGMPIQELFRALEERMSSVPGLQWRPKSPPPAPTPPTTLAITRIQFGDPVMLGCASLETTIEFDAHSEDDQLDGHFAGKLTGLLGSDRHLTIETTMITGDLMGPARVDIPSDAPFSLTIHWRSGDPKVVSGALSAGMQKIGWVSNDGFPVRDTNILPTPAPAFDVVQSDLQRTACANIAPTTLATFDTEDTLKQSVSKRWILCEGRTNIDFVGLEIDSAGHWRQLNLENGELVAARGFGHEGQVVRNVFASDFNLALLDMLPQRYDFYHAGLSADGNTLRLDGQQTTNLLNATFQASDLPVREPPTTFEKGERAGEAACTAVPMNLTTRPATVDAFRALLAGTWTFCRGRLGTSHAAVRFEAGGHFAFLAADGRVAEEGTFMVIDTSSQNGPGAYQVNLTASGMQVVFSLPLFSSAPVMMMVNDESQSVLSAM
jgi:hypothetical protein